jgi:leucyl-tRNA synthetase
VYCENDGWVAVPDAQLPVELPNVEKYEPTDTGESPLAHIDSFVNTTCPTCGGPAKRETDTMPNWAGSSWYFLRYTDPNNQETFASKEVLKYWMPVDIYNGGMEHTTLHLLYSRFWNKFLFDQGLVPTSEPYQRRHSHGLILAEDGRKMSKSWGNVVNPDDVVQEHGADTLRLYEVFMGPFEEPVPWSTNGVIGIRRFLDKVIRLGEKCASEQTKDDREVSKALHKMIEKVSKDIEAFRFNTAVAQLMMLMNTVQEKGAITKDSFALFLRVLVPFAPHVANELWEKLGFSGFVEEQPWPVADSTMIMDDEIELGVQVNGKLRASIIVAADASEDDIIAKARAEENVAKYCVTEPKKTIVVKGKLVNFVVEA